MFSVSDISWSVRAEKRDLNVWPRIIFRVEWNQYRKRGKECKQLGQHASFRKQFLDPVFLLITPLEAYLQWFLPIPQCPSFIFLFFIMQSKKLYQSSRTMGIIIWNHMVNMYSYNEQLRTFTYPSLINFQINLKSLTEL